MTSPKAGGSAFSYQLVKIRDAAEAMQQSLMRMDGAGAATLTVLIAKTALQLTVIFSALNELERIVRAEKSARVKVQG